MGCGRLLSPAFGMEIPKDCTEAPLTQGRKNKKKTWIGHARGYEALLLIHSVTPPSVPMRLARRRVPEHAAASADEMKNNNKFPCADYRLECFCCCSFAVKEWHGDCFPLFNLTYPVIHFMQPRCVWWSMVGKQCSCPRVRIEEWWWYTNWDVLLVLQRSLKNAAIDVVRRRQQLNCNGF